MDRYDANVRTRMMRAVRSRGTRLETKAYPLLTQVFGKRGLQAQPKLPGKPDFVRRTRSDAFAIFLDSCFWHGCSEHLRLPVTNRAYWVPKILRNRARDRLVTRRLKADGFTVVRVWEHELRDVPRLLRRLTRIAEKTARGGRHARTSSDAAPRPRARRIRG